MNDSHSSPSLADKIAQFKEYFTVEQDVNINVVPVSDQHSLPGYDEFIRNMPYSFRLASEVASLEAAALRPLRNIATVGDDLVTFLKAQSRKIDLIMSYMLSMEDDKAHRLISHSFGGGGITYYTDTPLPIGQLVQLKLFFTDEASAIFCYGEVIEVKPQDDKHLICLYYARIREEDREIIVRASLHQQSKQLKRKAQIKRQS